MKREETFIQSHRPYAVDLASFRPLEKMNRDPRGAQWYGVAAVWFRRRSIGWGDTKRIVTVACVGQLRDLQRQVPADAAQFLERHGDGRYGGDCRSRWDGHQFWSANQDPDVQAADLALLKPILDSYPSLPAGYSGWWTFR